MIKSNSVWYRELNQGLKDLIENNFFIDGKKVPTKVRSEEEDFIVGTYPSCTLYIVSDSFDNKRYNQEDVITEIDKVRGVAIKEESAKPFNIQVQLSFWTKLQSQIDYLSMTFNARYPKYINLPVVDSSGTPRNIYCRVQNGLRQDNLSDGSRIFRYLVTLKASVELDETITTEVPIVLETPRVNGVHINNKEVT